MVQASMTRRLALARPNIGAREIELVTSVLRSDTLAMGPFNREFERRLSAMVGRRTGVAVSSGTAGLHLAVRSLGIGEGDEVITTPFSFVASSNSILYEGARPVFVDIEEETLGLDPASVPAASTERTRAILAVDVFGMPCKIDELEALVRTHGWRLIEDSCEALGSSYHGRPLGSFGDISVFAFYPNKQITTGEGGMIVTDDPSIEARLRSMENQGRDEDGTWLRHVQLGYNYRLDELSAALGVAQLERYAELRRGREHTVSLYEAALGGRDWLRLPRGIDGADVDWFVYVIRVSPRVDRDRLIRQLDRRGVPARPYFAPIHLQPVYAERFGYRRGQFPVTEAVAASTLALPFSSQMLEDEVAQVVEALDDAVEEQGPG